MILDKVFNLDRTVVVSGAGLDQDATLKRVFGIGPTTHSGIKVNEETPMTVAGWFAAVRLLSWTTAYLPLFVYRRQANGDRSAAPEHPVYQILHNRPNPMQNSMVYRETSMMHVILWGNAYSYIERDQAGRPLALWQLHPSKVNPKVVNRRLKYEIPDATDLPVTRGVYADFEILHVPGIGFNGVTGQSIVSFAAESVGEAVAAERFASGFYKGGAVQNLVIKYPSKLQEGTADRLRDMWRDKHSNPSAGPAVLEEGMDVATIGIPQKDAQYIESRKFSVTEAARWMGVPPHKIADMEAATFSNIGEQNIEFTQALLPWMRRFEQEYDYKLFSDTEHQSLFVEHVVEGLLAGDPEKRANAFATALQNGYMNRDEVRRLLNLNAMPEGGDVFTVQTNLAPLDKLGQEPEPEPEPDPADEPPEEEDVQEPTDDQQDEEDDGEREAVRTIARASLQDALQRMIHKQCVGLRRRLRKHPEQFVNQMTKHHDEFERKMQAGITPACDVCKGIGIDVEPARIVPTYLQETRSKLLELCSCPGSQIDKMVRQVDHQLLIWETLAAEEITETEFRRTKDE